MTALQKALGFQCCRPLISHHSDFDGASRMLMDFRRMNEIVRENRGITAYTAMRLDRYFGTSERFWLNLQTKYELRQAQVSKAEQVAREVKPHAA